MPLKFVFRDINNDGTLSAHFERIDIVTSPPFDPTAPNVTWRAEWDTTGLGGQAQIPPKAGDVYQLKLTYPLQADDQFVFSTTGDKVAGAPGTKVPNQPYVVPNPYVGAASFEPARFAVSGRGERRLEFRAVPHNGVVRIYTVRGDLVQTLRQDGGPGCRGSVGPAHEGQPRHCAGALRLPGRGAGSGGVRRQVRGDQVSAARVAGRAPAGLAALLGLAFALVLVAAQPQLARAQSKTGTTVGTFLTIEPDARLAGMGNAGASIGDGLEAYWFNPAAAAGLTHKEALALARRVDRRHPVTTTWRRAFRSAISARAWCRITSLRSGDIDVRTVSQPLGTGERYNVADVAIGLGLARPITDRFRVGGQISIMQERIFNSTLGAASVNLGAIYRVTDEGLVMGASLANLGVGGRFSGDNLSVTFDEDPSRNGDNGSLPASIFTDHFGMPILMRFGAAWPWKIDAKDKITFAVDALHPSDNSESLSLGAEYAYKTLFALRGGWQRLPSRTPRAGSRSAPACAGR